MSRLWSGGRSQAELRDGMREPREPCPSLLGQWLLNEGMGVTALNSAAATSNGVIVGSEWDATLPSLPVTLPATQAPVPVRMTVEQLQASVLVPDASTVVMYHPGSDDHNSRHRAVFQRFSLQSGLLLEESLLDCKDWGLGCAAASDAATSRTLWAMSFPSPDGSATVRKFPAPRYDAPPSFSRGGASRGDTSESLLSIVVQGADAAASSHAVAAPAAVSVDPLDGLVDADVADAAAAAVVTAEAASSTAVAASTLRFLEALVVTASMGSTFALEPSPAMFSTVRRIIGAVADALCGSDAADAASRRRDALRLFALDVMLQVCGCIATRASRAASVVSQIVCSDRAAVAGAARARPQGLCRFGCRREQRLPCGRVRREARERWLATAARVVPGAAELAHGADAVCARCVDHAERVPQHQLHPLCWCVSARRCCG
jgi:hypothetical protein